MITDAQSSTALRALVVSNMAPGPGHPARGVFVRDQVAALRRTADVDVELFEFAPGAGSYPRAAWALRRRYGGERFDVVHAHFGLTAWPALAVAARARAVTLHGTDVRHPRTRRLAAPALARADLVAGVSASLLEELPAGSTARAVRAVLPCGVDLERFRPVDRPAARAQLGWEGRQRVVLFPADPGRAVKRHDRARAVARAVGPQVRLVAAGDVEPARMALMVGAADAVLVPSEAEGFGLAAIEALACNVPVLATPVGVHRAALEGIPGCLCAKFETRRWAAFLEAVLQSDEPRVQGRTRAGAYSSDALAAAVVAAWRGLLAG